MTGVASIVDLFCLQQVCAVRQFVLLEAVLALGAATGVLAGSGLAGGGLLLACDDGNALVLALILLHLRVGALSLVRLLLEM